MTDVIDYAATAEQTAVAYAEAFGKRPPEYGMTNAYAWERMRHERECPRCHQMIPVGGYGLKADGQGQSKHKHYHVRCFDWLSLSDFTSSGAPARRAGGPSMTKQLEKALDTPTFRLDLGALQGRIQLDITNPYVNEKNEMGSPKWLQKQLGISKGYATALWAVAKARLDAEMSAAAAAVLGVDDLLQQLQELEEV